MKKFILSLSILASFIVANPLEFKTLSSNFKQSVTSEEAKIEYAGNFIATRTNAFWHYESPNLKDIYFSFDRVVVIEPDLEQAIITTIKNTPNLTEILANAKPNKNGIYEDELLAATGVKMSALSMLERIHCVNTIDNTVFLNERVLINDTSIIQ